MRREKIGPLEFDVISCLLDQPEDAYGLTIRDRLASTRKPSLGAVYTTLERLESKGMVSSWWSEGTSERGGRRKRLYRVETQGRQAATEFSARFQCRPVAEAVGV
jgi:PadR family transcriptional regulator PadR